MGWQDADKFQPDLSFHLKVYGVSIMKASNRRQSSFVLPSFSMVQTTGHLYSLDEVLKAYSRLVALGYPEAGAFRIISSSYPEQADALKEALK